MVAPLRSRPGRLTGEKNHTDAHRAVDSRNALRNCGAGRQILRGIGGAAQARGGPGRLGGAELARREWYREGRVPLQTLRADIDYGFSEANTTYGKIGIKTWIYKGEIFDGAPKAI